ncbi:similar to An08g02820 [Aspergillus luchuensis]|uniref:Similar to An08g02820 n=1 Tax=Aspergillus kawachii TaxID=1069201 RepID=A0A146FX41_ASPKA|nr:similar to An08g02820 [Aspergillus luchuensis]
MASQNRIDFECSGAQEWTLPGYGKQGYYPSQASAKTGTDQAIPDVPKATPDELPKQPPAAPAIKGTPSTPVRPAVVPRPARGRGGYRGRIGRSSGVSPKPNLFGDSPAKSKWRGKLEPTGKIRSCDTIYLWGEPFQVAAAKDIILTIVAKCNNASKKKVVWEKIMAHSVSKEARVELKERYDARLQVLQKQPDSSSEFSDLVSKIGLPVTYLFDRLADTLL